LHGGHRDRAVTFAGVTFKSGQWVYADADGILVSDTPLHS
jgi:regulator of ribonuclease activity A